MIRLVDRTPWGERVESPLERWKKEAAGRRWFQEQGILGTRAQLGPRPLPSPAERLLKMIDRAKAPRLTTGLPTLDQATRGGYPMGKLVVVGGAPGAAKTGLVVSLAHHWATGDVPVVVVAADEAADNLAIRLGQQLGFDRVKLEAGDAEECARAAMAIETLHRLQLIDPDEGDGLYLEDIAGRLTEPSILIVDSLQSVRVRAAARATDRRAVIDAALTVLKAVRRDGHLVFVTCELARGAYRNADASANTNPLAAFKESGGIEYAVDQALVLVSRKGTGAIIDVVMPKNRLGPKQDFALQLDFMRAQVAECTAPPPAFDPLARAKRRVLSWVEDNTRHLPLSKSALAEQAGGNQMETRKAISALLEDGALVQDRHMQVTLPHETLARMSGIERSAE